MTEVPAKKKAKRLVRAEVSHLDEKPVTMRDALGNRNVMRLLLMGMVVVYLVSLAVMFNPNSPTGNMIALDNSPVKASVALFIPLVLSGIALFVLSRKPDNI